MTATSYQPVGLIVGIHRETRTVDFVPVPIPGVDVEGDPIAPFTSAYEVEPPPGLTECYFTPDWRICLGPIMPPMEIVREHFTIMENIVDENTAPVAVADTGPWLKIFGGGTQGTGAITNTIAINDGHGVVHVRCRNLSGNNARIAKDASAIARPAGSAMWYQTRIQVPNVTDMQFQAGLVNDGLSGSIDDRAGIFFSSSGAAPDTTSIWARTEAAGNVSWLILPYTATTGIWYDFDMLLDSDQGFCAFWINGDGPYVLTSNVPTLPLTPWLKVETGTNAVKSLYCDNIFVDAVYRTRHPILVGLA